MFKPHDSGLWEFRPGRAACVFTPAPVDSKVQPRVECHPQIAFALISRDLDMSPPSLWVMQLAREHFTVPGNPARGDPLGQRSAGSEPLLQVYFARSDAVEMEYWIQQGDQVMRPTTVKEVLATITSAVAQWMVEGLR